MSNNALPTNIPGDKLKKALKILSEEQEKNPQKSRASILHEIELKLDLTPLECEFLNRNFSGSE